MHSPKAPASSPLLDAAGTHDDAKLWIYRADKETGRFVAFADGELYHLVGQHDRRRLPPVRSHGDWIAAGDHNPDWNRCSLMGMTHRDGKLYISSYLTDAVLVVDADSGVTEAEIGIPGPCGLAFDAEGRLLAVSGKEVVVVDPATGSTERLVGGLEAPLALATDPQGNLYVSDWAREM